jgi:hypothetical protein
LAWAIITEKTPNSVIYKMQSPGTQLSNKDYKRAADDVLEGGTKRLHGDDDEDADPSGLQALSLII